MAVTEEGPLIAHAFQGAEPIGFFGSKISPPEAFGLFKYRKVKQ